jgi:integrase
MAKNSKKPKKRTNGDGYLKQKKNGKWEGYATLGHDVKGKPIRQYFTCDTRDLALAKMQELTAQRTKGIDVEAYKLTLGDYLTRWLSYKKRDLRKTTYNEYSKVISKRITPHLGEHLLVKLTPLHVEEFVTKLFDAGDSVPTVRVVVKVLKNALSQAVLWNLIGQSPAMRVRKPKAVQKEISVWSPEDTLKFLETAKHHKSHKRLYPLFHLALSTGLRRGEILGLHWSDILGDTLTVKRALVAIDNEVEINEPKTATSKRKIFLSADCMEVLNTHRALQREQLGEIEIVFPSLNGNYIHPRNLLRAFHKVIADAGVSRIRFHDLRHAHASLLIKNGVSPMVVSERLGHADPAITLRVYTHLYESQRREGAVPLKELLN